ncbi:hypothetical protein BDZ91DRAFT_746902 [Kalaharituber pfeilii]|nr:hypothetical protein BDZ91DRAFT_746902 [Kalaharituber pfeilii]
MYPKVCPPSHLPLGGLCEVNQALVLKSIQQTQPSILERASDMSSQKPAQHSMKAYPPDAHSEDASAIRYKKWKKTLNYWMK